jgi:hypothetical protein
LKGWSDLLFSKAGEPWTSDADSSVYFCTRVIMKRDLPGRWRKLHEELHSMQHLATYKIKEVLWEGLAL